MNAVVVELLYGLFMAIFGVAGASWVWRSRFRRESFAENDAEARRASEVLVRLLELTTRAAFDVDEHSNQVEEINDKLSSVGRREPTMIVNAVAKLIEANQHMHEKLAATEDKLRQQAQEIQTRTAEARTDSLTLLANRRAFDDELARRASEFMRFGHVFSLIMVNVDHFKKFNDAHGHQAGDEVLCAIAKLLHRKMRAMDLVGRYGGEEYAVILPGTNLDDACKAALRACEAVEKARFRHNGQELRVTASFGVAEMSGCRDGAALVGRADKALYAAKEGGRNCVCSHDGKDVSRVLPNRPPVPPAAETQRREVSVPGGHEQGEKTRSASETTKPAPRLHRPLDLGTLSGLTNRTTFCQQVRNRTAEWKRGGPTFSVILLEVDKSDEGEEDRGPRELAVVRAATRFLSATVREMDTVGYYAPGCIALLLPTAGLPDAVRVGERLRGELSNCIAPALGEQSGFTLSVGVVQVMEGDDAILVLKRAEAALEAANRQRGNCAYCHDGGRCAPITAILEIRETADGLG